MYVTHLNLFGRNVGLLSPRRRSRQLLLQLLLELILNLLLELRGVVSRSFVGGCGSRGSLGGGVGFVGRHDGK